MVLRFDELYSAVKEQYEHLQELSRKGCTDRRLLSDCYNLTTRLFDEATDNADLAAAQELSEIMVQTQEIMQSGLPRTNSRLYEIIRQGGLK